MLGYVGRICRGKILIMLLAARHDMDWVVEAKAAGSPADATCNCVLWRFCGAAGLQSSDLGELWLLVVLRVWCTSEGARLWWEMFVGKL